jgi:hypothetical protein
MNPVQSLMNGQVPPQGLDPVALARRRGAGFPTVLVNPISQAVADGMDGGLKTLEIIPGSHTDHTTAIRTLISFQPERLIISVKISGDKPVPPDPPTTPRALLRPGPKEPPTRLKKMLDSQRNKDYQGSRFEGIYSPAVSGARVSDHPCPILF